MKNFNLLLFNIIGMDIKKEFVSLTVIMQVECFDYITNKPMYFIFTKLVPIYRKIIRKKSKKEIENEDKKNN